MAASNIHSLRGSDEPWVRWFRDMEGRRSIPTERENHGMDYMLEKSGLRFKVEAASQWRRELHHPPGSYHGEEEVLDDGRDVAQI